MTKNDIIEGLALTGYTIAPADIYENLEEAYVIKMDPMKLDLMCIWKDDNLGHGFTVDGMTFRGKRADFWGTGIHFDTIEEAHKHVAENLVFMAHKLDLGE